MPSCRAFRARQISTEAKDRGVAARPRLPIPALGSLAAGTTTQPGVYTIFNLTGPLIFGTIPLGYKHHHLPPHISIGIKLRVDRCRYPVAGLTVVRYELAALFARVVMCCRYTGSACLCLPRIELR